MSNCCQDNSLNVDVQSFENPKEWFEMQTVLKRLNSLERRVATLENRINDLNRELNNGS